MFQMKGKYIICFYLILISVSRSLAGGESSYSKKFVDYGKDCAQEDDGVTFPHGENCDQFCVCIDGAQIVVSCPNGFYYNIETGICDIPDTAGCPPNLSTSTPSTTASVTYPSSTRTTTISSSTTVSASPTQKPTTAKVTRPSSTTVTQPTTITTTKKVSTTDGSPTIAVTQSTSAPTTTTTITTTTTKSSEPASTSVGGISSTIIAPTSTSEWPEIPTECPEINGPYAIHLKHEADCCLFYTCDNGRKIVQSCPEGLLFNPFLQVCDWPRNVECDNDSINGL